MVAYASLKTPTAVAEYLNSNLQEAENQALNIFADIRDIIKNKIDADNRKIDQTKLRIKQTLRSWVVQKTHLLERQKSRLQSNVRMQLLKQNNRLVVLEKSIDTYSPVFLLRHGYTITTLHGKRVTSAGQVKAGDKIHTYVHDGEFGSNVE